MTRRVTGSLITFALLVSSLGVGGCQGTAPAPSIPPGADAGDAGKPSEGGAAGDAGDAGGSGDGAAMKATHVLVRNGEADPRRENVTESPTACPPSGV
jgi:hypothetical protein